ncbi:MAG: hypothetical protein ACXVX3_06525 [Blastococcus sp.]
MTHSIDTPPPTTTGLGTASTRTHDTPPATKDVAMGEAQDVKDTAVQAGSQVASTATDQAKEVAQETQRQAKDLLDQGRTQLRDQAVTQQHKAADGLSALAQELRGLVQGDGAQAGPAHDLLSQATGKVEELAGWLQHREPADLLNEVRSFARHKPGVFLLGAAAAGIVAGRLTSGVKAAHSDSGPSGSGPATGYRAQSNYVDPAPAYSEPTFTETTFSDDSTSTGMPSATPGTGAPLPPPPYGTVPPAGSIVPPASPAGWDDPARRPGGVG